jgi:HAD superfamily hydrolase (TIGR01509 family)
LQAVIFDLDGLMVNSETLAHWAWSQVLARYGRRLDDEAFRETRGLRVVDSARFFCERFSLPIGPAEAMAERQRLFLEAVPARLRACPGLYPLLDELDARRLPLAVATSGERQYVTLALQTLGLERRFRAVVTGDEVERGKPAPDVYLLAAERLGVLSARCLALEDAPLGLESARAAGMVCVAVPGEWSTADEFPGAYRVVPSLDAVREALDDLLAAPLDDRFVCYTAAGGVVVRDGRVLVLRRPDRDEVRLPKGHVEPGETAQEAALRETREESGYADLAVRANLGAQLVQFNRDGQRVVRIERYFLMSLVGQASRPVGGEPEFEPAWLPWDESLAALTFEPEREWVRRARRMTDEQ